MSISVNVGNFIPAEVVEVGQEISVNQLAAITAATSPSAVNPFTTLGHTHVAANITDLEGILALKSNTSHTHVIGDITGLQTALDAKAIAGHIHNIWDTTNLQTTLDGKAPLVHTHAIANITNLQATLDGKASTIHFHTGVYAPYTHSHAIANITNLQTTLDGKALLVHTHAIANTTGLQTALDGKALLVHTHSLTDTIGLQTALDGKASTTHTHTGTYAPVTHTHSLTDVIALDTALANKSDIGHGHTNYALLAGATFYGEISSPQIGNLLNQDLIIDAYNDTGSGTHYYHKFNPNGGLVLAPNGGYLNAGDYSVSSDGFTTSWIEGGDMGRSLILSKDGLTWDIANNFNWLPSTGFTFSDKVTIPSPTVDNAKLNIGSVATNLALTNTAIGDVWIGSNQMCFKNGNNNIVWGAGTNVSNVFNSPQIIDTTHATLPAIRVTQKGTGHALIVEDVLNPDTTAFVITNNGAVGIGVDAGSGPFAGDANLVVRMNDKTRAASFRRTGSTTDNGEPVVWISGYNGTYNTIGLSVIDSSLLIQTYAGQCGLKIGPFQSGAETRALITAITKPMIATGTYDKEIPINIDGVNYRIPCRIG